MIDYILGGGYAMWAVPLCGVVMLVMAIRGWRSGRGAAPDMVLFWALSALAVGFIGTLVGISQMAAALSAAPVAPAALVWGGARLALSTTIVGTLVFVLGLACWTILRSGAERRERA